MNIPSDNSPLSRRNPGAHIPLSSQAEKIATSTANQPHDQAFEPPHSLSLFGANIHNLSESEALDWISYSASTGGKSTAFFANANLLNIAYRNPSLIDTLNSADRIFADGSGIRMAARHQRRPLQANLNGTDLFPKICRRAERQGLSIFFLGATKSVLCELISNTQRNYPQLHIAGSQHGYFDHWHCDHIIDHINQSHCDILFTAFGMPLQEEWLASHREKLNAPLALTVGGLFDFYSGRITRAPKALRAIGAEWTWRLAMEPRRLWRRYLIGNPLFLYRLYRQQPSIVKITKH